MHAGGARLDHRAHQLVRVQGAAEARLRVGDDRHQVVDLARAVGPLDLVGPAQGVVDPAHDRRDAVRRVEALVGIRGLTEIRVRSDLPAREVDRLQTGLHHLRRLAARQRTQRCDLAFAAGEVVPQLLGAASCQRVLDMDRPTLGARHRLPRRSARSRPSGGHWPIGLEVTMRNAAPRVDLSHHNLLEVLVLFVVAFTEVRALALRRLGPGHDRLAPLRTDLTSQRRLRDVFASKN